MRVTVLSWTYISITTEYVFLVRYDMTGLGKKDKKKCGEFGTIWTNKVCLETTLIGPAGFKNHFNATQFNIS